MSNAGGKNDIANKDARRDESIEELYRRGKVRKYFLGAGDFRSGEGVGYLLGGGLCIFLGGWLFPTFLTGSTVNGHERYIFLVMALLGVLLFVKGIYETIKDLRKVRLPTTDEEMDAIFQRDLSIARKRSEEKLKNTFQLAEDQEYIHLHGPNFYSSNVNLPLLWKGGSDNVLRYSNFSLITYAPSNEGQFIYVYTCIYNVRNGFQKFEHTYKYSRTEIEGAVIEDRTLEGLDTQQKRPEDRKVCMISVNIAGRDGDMNELSLILKDYGEMERHRAHIDDSETRKAFQRLLKHLEKEPKALQP